MELVLIVTFAGLIGLALRYIIPGRTWHGLALMPSLGVVVGSLAWAAAVWVGLDPASAWPWVASLVLTLIITAIVGVIIPRRREEADQALWAQLTSR
jgi:quaternary ammonium compound-resistance protein SugE